MRRYIALTIVVGLAVTASALAGGPSVTLSLEAIKNGQTVGQGMPILWTIKVNVSDGDNDGLALVSVDLVQDAGNAAHFDLPPADGVPPEMTNFSRPAGISNPGEGGATTGYIGVQRGPEGQKNLVQIGGGQNTFGEALPPGTGIGENANVVGGVGQGPTPQLVAAGKFIAPSTPGAYVFRIENGLANVLTAVNPPPDFSPVVQAAVALSPGSFGFTVSNYAIGDMNCDGSVDGFDIQPFVLALTNPSGYDQQYPNCDRMLADCNGDGAVDGFDIQAFVDALTGK